MSVVDSSISALNDALRKFVTDVLGSDFSGDIRQVIELNGLKPKVYDVLHRSFDIKFVLKDEAEAIAELFRTINNDARLKKVFPVYYDRKYNKYLLSLDELVPCTSSRIAINEVKIDMPVSCTSSKIGMPELKFSITPKRYKCENVWIFLGTHDPMISYNNLLVFLGIEYNGEFDIARFPLYAEFVQLKLVLPSILTVVLSGELMNRITKGIESFINLVDKYYYEIGRVVHNDRSRIEDSAKDVQHIIKIISAIAEGLKDVSARANAIENL